MKVSEIREDLIRFIFRKKKPNRFIDLIEAKGGERLSNEFLSLKETETYEVLIKGLEIVGSTAEAELKVIHPKEDIMIAQLQVLVDLPLYVKNIVENLSIKDLEEKVDQVLSGKSGNTDWT